MLNDFFVKKIKSDSPANGGLILPLKTRFLSQKFEKIINECATNILKRMRFEILHLTTCWDKIAHVTMLDAFVSNTYLCVVNIALTKWGDNSPVYWNKSWLPLITAHWDIIMSLWWCGFNMKWALPPAILCTFQRFIGSSC